MMENLYIIKSNGDAELYEEVNIINDGFIVDNIIDQSMNGILRVTINYSKGDDYRFSTLVGVPFMISDIQN